MKRIASLTVLVTCLFAVLFCGNAAIHAAGQTGPIELVQPDSITCADFSPDGKLIAINSCPYSSGKPITVIWERSTGRKLHTLLRHDGDSNDGASLLAFSPDGKKLAAVCYVGRGDTHSHLTIWDVATWRKEQTLKTKRGFGFLLSFSPNGKLLLTDTDYKAAIWSIEKGVMLKKFDDDFYNSSHLQKIRFYADGKTLLNMANGQRIDIVTGDTIPAPKRPGDEDILYQTETTSGEQLSLVELRGGNKRSYAAIFIKDGNAPSKTIPLEIDGEIRSGFCVSPDGNNLWASIYPGEGYAIWNLRTGKWIGKMPFERLEYIGSGNGYVMFLPDGESFMVCLEKSHRDGSKIQIWNINSAAGVSKKQADKEAQKKADDERMLREALE